VESGEAKEMGGISTAAPGSIEPPEIFVGAQGPDITRIEEIKIFMDFQKRRRPGGRGPSIAGATPSAAAEGAAIARGDGDPAARRGPARSLG
jgi:hypothetical protein